MATVASVDYVNKRIYLHQDTVGVTLDTLDVYRDVRDLRVTAEAHRKFKPIIVAGGNIQKTATTFTSPYVQLLYGCRIIPYDTDQNLKVIRDTFTDDGFAGRDCFDRSSLVNEVNIDFEVDKVEVRVVYASGDPAPTVQQIRQEMDNNSLKLNAVYELGTEATAKAPGSTPGYIRTTNLDIEITKVGDEIIMTPQ